MADPTSIAVATVTGFVSGWLLSVPVGPINVTIINEGARRGFGWALMIGLGATVMEVLYCGIAFTGFASLLSGPVAKLVMELGSIVFLLYLGLRFLLARHIPAHGRIEERLEQRLHPHSAFWTGFVRCLGNPGVLLFWIVLAANFTSRGWVAPDFAHRFACLVGVTLGVGLWFLSLSWAVSRGHRRLSEHTLLRMERVSGVVLLGFASVHGVHLVWQLANHSR
jgi:threonine/homoserine/homoserine lactone efflux protein